MTGKILQNFDNMIAQFVYQGHFMEENIAIKHVWQKGKNVFFDLYFYRTQTNKIIDAAYIKTMYNLSTDKGYTDMHKFIEDYFDNIEIEETEEIAPTNGKKVFNFTAGPLEAIKEELLILNFLLNCSNGFEDVKLKSVFDFAQTKSVGKEPISGQYLKAFLKSLSSEEEDFYQSLAAISHKKPEDAQNLLKEAIKLCISDGGLNYCERIYLAEIIQTLREHNINIYFG